MASSPDSLEPPAKRFGTTSTEEREKLVESAICKRTTVATMTWVNAFNQYCKEDPIDLKAILPSDLARKISAFYADARKQDGSEYKRGSLIACRSALARHISSVRPGVDIINGEDFKPANRMLDAVLKEKQRNGREPAVEHKRNISDSDWEKLQVYFEDILATRDPRKLTMYVWFVVSLHFCLRGSELQARLRKQDLVFNSVDGVETITIATDFLTKNTQGGLKGRSFETKGCISDPKQVQAVKFYLERLHPDLDRLFQRAKVGRGESVSPVETCWFVKQGLSHNILSGMMKQLSESACLSYAYTNHCLRSTSVVHMREAGLADRQIASVTGHKNLLSLASYDSLSTKDCAQFAAAIDKKSSSSLDMRSVSSVHEKHSLSTLVSDEKENSQPPCGFVINAEGASFTNVTFNVTAPQPPPARKKFSLSLKERRAMAAAKGALSERQ